MAEMAETGLSAKLIELLDEVRAEQQALLADLTDEERAATGSADHWAVKDVFAHITTWKARSAARLRCAARGETPPDTRDFDAFNARDFEEHREQPWADALADEARVHAEFVEAVRHLSDDELATPGRYAWMDGRPLCLAVLSNGVTHPVEHLVKLAIARGEAERGLRIQERLAAALADATLPESVRGIGLYNLACMYATSGQSAQALEALSEGLRLTPRLVVEARADQDFSSLRELPEFQALIAERALS